MKRNGNCRLTLAWGAASFFERAENWIDQVLEDNADTAHGIVVGGDWVSDDGWVGVAVQLRSHVSKRLTRKQKKK